MKKVLLVSYSFPPAGGIGVQRNLKFVKYLPEFGWQSVVLTMKSDYFFLQDNQLMNDIPQNTKVFRTNCIKPKQKQLSWTKLNTRNSNIFLTCIYSVLRFIENAFLIIDIWIGWLPFGLFTGYKIAKKEKINVIVCSGPSFTSFLIGYLLSKKSKLPLILDYRDGWTIDARRKTSKLYILKNTIDRLLEIIILKHSANIIFVSEELLQLYSENFKFIKDKSSVIFNGFDPCDLDKNKTSLIKNKVNEFIISHIGGCDPLTRKPLIILFLNLLTTIVDINPEIKKLIRLKFVGIVPPDIKDQIKKCRLDDIAEIKDFVPREQALEIMDHSDALLLFTDLSLNNKTVLTGKLFEYLMTHKPILAFAPKHGAASNIIEETASGTIIDCETQTKKEMLDNISAFIEKLLNKKLIIENHNLIKKYHRKELTKSLANILNKTTP